MVVASGSSIEAVLTLNATSFDTGLNKAISSVKSFVSQVNSSEGSLKAFGTAVQIIGENLMDATGDITRFNREVGSMRNFNQFANGVKALAQSIQILGENSSTSAVGMEKIMTIIEKMKGSFGTTTVEVRGLASAIRELNVQENNGINATTQYKLGATNVQQAFTSMSNSTKEGRRNLSLYHQNLKALALGIEQFNAIETKSTASINQNTNATRQAIATDEQYRVLTLQTESMLQRKIASLQRNSEAMRQNGAETLRNMGYKGKLTVENERVAMSEEKQSVATDKATNSMRRQETASKGLGRALSSLRMMGTMVGSMIAYNFVHNLAMATTETINAKSEMNGYFQMLGYTTRQTEDFNRALDRTVEKFPRLNKYALGETISSIGVEFELTTKEMKKAMPVVSMITSEYLRAGRNVNEASLAVKDILQGEFQRLSRETGVKGDQLKEAGWSGDKSDVMGLLKALEKVGKERNWDTFVQKANSLNDAVLILQNRFSEWSADMVERIQPAILSVFNNLMIIGTDFGKAFNKVLDWLSGDGLGQSIVKWGGLALAIGNVVSGLIVYRTGANLTQIAQMGLIRSIGATILGLEAETVAQYGLRTSIIANVTHMEAEEVARQGRLNSILASITGLKAEEVAQMGKARALASSILGLDMATVKTYGFTTALWSNITGVEAETIAVEGWNAQMFIAVAELGILAGAMAVFTGALIVQAIKISETTEQYKKFVNMVDKGDEIIAEAKDNVDNLTTKKKDLTDKLATLEKGTYAYNVTANKLKVTTDDLTTANQNYSDAVNSVAWAKHKQDLYDEEKASAQASAQREINEALLDYGFNVKEASQLSNQYWNDAINGWNQHYETLQKVNLQYSKNATSVSNALKQLNETKLDDKEVTVLIRRKITAGNEIADAKEELGNATSLTEYVDKWLWLQVRQLQNSLVDWDINMASGGIQQAIGGVVMGILHFFGDNFIGQFTQGLARDWGLEGSGTRVVNSIMKDGIIKFITDALHLDTLQSDLGNIISSATNNFDLIGMLLDAILPAPASASDGSSDHPSFMQDISNILGFDIQSWITNFNTDPLGTLGIQLPQIDIIGLITSLIPIGGEGGFDIGAWLGSIFNIDGIVASFTSNLNIIFTTASTIASNVSGVFSNLKNMIWGHIQGILSNVTSTFTNIRNVAVNQVNGLSSGIRSGIDKVVGAFNYMKDAILNSARAIYDGVKSKFDSVKNTIGDFWHNLTNPSSWGSAGSESYQRRSPKPQTARRMFSPVIRSAVHHGAGINPYKDDSQSVKLKDLMGMIDGDNKVRLSDFLSMFTEGGFGAWDFHEPVKKRVFDTAKNYKTGSPTIKGIGTVGDGYKVEKFWNGKPSFSFSEFQAVAQAIFSAIPYKFYYDSEWKGNWVNALLSGAVNCSDGADALIALARVFGFKGYKQHTTLKNGVGHFFAVIGNKAMDTTNFQNHGSWSPLGGAGIPTRTSTSARTGRVDTGKTVNITVDMQGATVYGVEDLDSRIEDSVKRGLREEFNDPYTIAI